MCEAVRKKDYLNHQVSTSPDFEVNVSLDHCFRDAYSMGCSSEAHSDLMITATPTLLTSDDMDTEKL